MSAIEQETQKSRDEYFEENEKIENREEKLSIYCSTIDLIVNRSIKTGLVFDLENKTFSDSIINSAATDIEILTAIIDLISILITGNQLVMTGKHNF